MGEGCHNIPSKLNTEVMSLHWEKALEFSGRAQSGGLLLILDPWSDLKSTKPSLFSAVLLISFYFIFLAAQRG